MRELTQNEIKENELELLRRFRRVCEEHGLLFYLSGGTLLGAVRHQGFIPWDDDIDVCMPRPDYDRLRVLCRRESLFPPHIRLVCFEDGTFDMPFMKLCDTRIYVSTDEYLDSSFPYLWIDIQPYDGLPEDGEEVRAIYDRIAKIRRIMMAGVSRREHGTTAFRRFIKPLVFRPYVRVVGLDRLSGKIHRIASAIPYDTASYCGAVAWGLYGPGERLKKDEFEIPAEVLFEGESYPTFSCWDAYLRGLYGDSYMQLPPPEKRKCHEMHAVRTDSEQAGAET
ncbi:MAG: LicD family protein [Clostridia bacterium]|nr:LicD family protein [Clostridia bacterium]